MAGDYPALERLGFALVPTIPGNLAAPWAALISGTVNTIGGGTGGTSMVDNNAFTPGGTSITPAGGYYGGRQVNSGNAAAPALSNSAILQVDVVKSVAGGGGGFATAAVYGSPQFPVYTVGSEFITNGSLNTISFGGSVGALGIGGSVGALGIGGSVGVLGLGGSYAVYGAGGSYAVYGLGGSYGVYGLGGSFPVFGAGGSYGVVGQGGSMGVVQLGAPWSMTGSVNVVQGTLPLPIVGSVNTTPQGVQVVDTRASLSPTQWIISFGGSGQSAAITGSVAGQRPYFSSYHLVATATIDLQWNSPSGVAITGSFRVLPGAGFALAGALPNGPVLIGSQGSSVFLAGNVVGNVGGVGIGWFGV